MSAVTAAQSRETHGRLVDDQVGQLAGLDLQQLRQVWIQRFGAAPPLRSAELVRMNLAWRIQAEAYGGLDAQTKLRLRRGSSTAAAGDQIEPGSRLVREWKGVRHEVIVEESGYLYAGERWKSLSQIASSIAGSRWNGPRFFGLRSDPVKGQDR